MKWLWLLVFLLALSITAALLPLREWLLSIASLFSEAGFSGAVLLALIIALWNMVLPPFPWQVLAGYCFSFPVAVGVIYVGSSLAVVASAALARGRLRPRIAQFIVHRPRWQALDRAIEQTGWKAIMLLRLCGLFPSNLANYACGMTALPIRTILWASWLGKAPGIILSVLMGASLAQAQEELSWTVVVGFSLAIAASVALAWFLGRESKRQLALMEGDPR